MQRTFVEKEAVAMYIRSPGYYSFLIDLEMEAVRVLSRARDIDRRIKAADLGIRRAREAVERAAEEKKEAAERKKGLGKSGSVAGKGKARASAMGSKKRGPLSAVEKLREQLEEAEAAEAAAKKGRKVRRQSMMSISLCWLRLESTKSLHARRYIPFISSCSFACPNLCLL